MNERNNTHAVCYAVGYNMGCILYIYKQNERLRPRQCKDNVFVQYDALFDEYYFFKGK